MVQAPGRGVEKVIIVIFPMIPALNACIKTGFLPQSSLPLGETRERGRL
jgi:hypothetical protein